MTGRLVRIRQMVGYAIGFVAAFVLWLLLGATTAHADDAARPAGDSHAATLTSSLVGVVDHVTTPLTQESAGLVHRTTGTVRKTVAVVPVLSTERHVEPVLRAIDRTVERTVGRTADSLRPITQPVTQPAGVPPIALPVEHATTPAPAPAAHPADTGRGHQHVAVHRASRSERVRPPAHADTRRLLRPAAVSSAPVDAVVSSVRSAAADAHAPAADAIVTPLAGPTAPAPSAPADRTSAASTSTASTDAAPSLLTAPRLPAGIVVPAGAAVDPLTATDPLPDCSPD